MLNYSEWDEYYKSYPLDRLGWELGRPRPILVEYLQKGFLPIKGKALDLCCGAGTNTIYLAKNNFDVTGIDVSLNAITIAKQRAKQTEVDINFLKGSFIDLSFKDHQFTFIFDMGCFHHVEIEDRLKFIKCVHRVLDNSGKFMLTCFSYQNGKRFNHFTSQKIIDLFSEYFDLGDFRHYPSIEGDEVIRFFYSVLMKKI